MNINKYIGIPYKRGGTKLDGLDCWGLLIHVLKHDFGIDVDVDYYVEGDLPCVARAYETASKDANWERIEYPIDGCVVALSKGKKIHHAGVWYGNGCLHAVKGQGVICSTVNSLKLNNYKRMEFYKWRQ